MYIYHKRVHTKENKQTNSQSFLSFLRFFGYLIFLLGGGVLSEQVPMVTLCGMGLGGGEPSLKYRHCRVFQSCITCKWESKYICVFEESILSTFWSVFNKSLTLLYFF